MRPQQRGPRIFVSDLDPLGCGSPDQLIVLPPESSHHIRDVLRLREDQALEIADPVAGSLYRGVIISTSPSVTLRIVEALQRNIDQLRSIILLCALCKGSKNDLVCDWATELGASHIIFWQASRSVIRLRDPHELNARESRLNKIAISAAQQSRQTKPPKVTVALSLAVALSNTKEQNDSHPHKVVCSLSPQALPMQTSGPKQGSCSSIHIAVGPEGDLTSEEMRMLEEHGFIPVSLGSSVLRSELAIVTALVTAKELLSQDRGC